MSELNFPYQTGQRYTYICDFIPSGTKLTDVTKALTSTPVVAYTFIDMSDITSMKYLYNSNTNIQISCAMDTSKVTTMQYMFSGCSNLITIPPLDTSKVTDMSYMFQKCSNLITIPPLDTSKVTTMQYMFSGCSNLITIPPLDTSKVTDMSYMFQNCNNLRSVPQMDCSSVTTVGYPFGYSEPQYLYGCGGFLNLGKQSSVSGTNAAYFISYAFKNLSKESILNVLNGLYDRASAGYKILTLKVPSTWLTILTDEEKAIATNKGWTLS